MTNQSPAEALRQQILSVFPVFEEELQYGLLANIDKPKVDKIMELVTAYAATVEREGRKEGSAEVIRRIREELVGAESPEINQDDSDVSYYYTTTSVEWAIERVENAINKENES